MHPQQILEELRQIKNEIADEKLTPEGRQATLEQVDQIETLILELKSTLAEDRKTVEQLS